ncbi:hypothetical protein HY734_00510 [Candidatus Uhrbacteria bacterium]|nr:hypothetical protein [Candidatus Uhrbacteria bacterium]
MLHKKIPVVFIVALALTSVALLIVIATTLRPRSEIRPQRFGDRDGVEEPKVVEPYVLNEGSPESEENGLSQETSNDSVTVVSAAFGDEMRFDTIPN